MKKIVVFVIMLVVAMAFITPTTAEAGLRVWATGSSYTTYYEKDGITIDSYWSIPEKSMIKLHRVISMHNASGEDTQVKNLEIKPFYILGEELVSLKLNAGNDDFTHGIINLADGFNVEEIQKELSRMLGNKDSIRVLATASPSDTRPEKLSGVSELAIIDMVKKFNDDVSWFSGEKKIHLVVLHYWTISDYFSVDLYDRNVNEIYSCLFDPYGKYLPSEQQTTSDVWEVNAVAAAIFSPGKYCLK